MNELLNLSTHAGPVIASASVIVCLAVLGCISRIHRIRAEKACENNRKKIHLVNPEGRK